MLLTVPRLRQSYKKAHRAKHSSVHTHTARQSPASSGFQRQAWLQEAGRYYLRLPRSSLHGTPHVQALLMSPHRPRCCQREKSRVPHSPDPQIPVLPKPLPCSQSQQLLSTVYGIIPSRSQGSWSPNPIRNPELKYGKKGNPVVCGFWFPLTSLALLKRGLPGGSQ